MRFGVINVERLEFPGRAGELQRQGASAAFIRELGDDYPQYHAFLAERLARYGGREPQPDAYPGFAEYIAACQEVRDIVMAEALLRNARAYRRTGRPLDHAYDPSIPLLDERNRLVSAVQE